MPEIAIPKCPRCGSQLVKIKDKPYYGCPAWLPDQKGCEGTIYYPEKYQERQYPLKLFSCKVPSRSNPGHHHIVVVYESGDIYCPCVASQMAKFCHHKQVVVRKVSEILEKIKKETRLNVRQDASPEGLPLIRGNVKTALQRRLARESKSRPLQPAGENKPRQNIPLKS